MENTHFQTPRGTKNPQPFDIKLDMCDYVGDFTLHAGVGVPAPTGAGLHMHEIATPLS